MSVMETKVNAKQELGRRIAEARNAARISGAALAEVIGGDKTTISKIEKGTRGVDGVELALIADRLGVGVRTLLGMPPRQKVLAVATRLRERGDGAAPALRRARELLEFDALLDELEEPNPKRPAVVTPQGGVGDSEAGAVELARRVRDQLALGVGGVQDLEALAEGQLGLDVAVEPLGEHASGVVVQCDGTALVVVNSDEVYARQRFTLAHEIGHYLMDDGELIVEDDAKPELEERANAFAAEFLMPEEGLRRVAGSFESPQIFVNTMLSFGVSRQALARRLCELGLLDADQKSQYENADVEQLFHRAGQSDALEDLQAHIGRRRVPSRVAARGIEAYQRGRIGIGPLAAMMARPSDELEAGFAAAGITPRLIDAVPVPAGAI